MSDALPAAALDWRKGAIPGLPGPSRGFIAHAVLALLSLLFLNWLVATYVPFEIKMIGDSYLIFFYHFPAALNVYLFYLMLLVFSVMYLKTKAPVWDRRARSAAEVGFLANMVLVLTGSTWAKAAWNAWWVWSDPRLMSAAVMSLIYLGYLMLQGAVEEPQRRRQISSVYGILAFVNIPVVYYSIQWFGQTSHPMKFDSMSADSIVQTRWYAVFAFLLLYAALYRWGYDRKTNAEHLEDALQRVRRIEERSQEA
jgi:heme exporter protein C